MHSMAVVVKLSSRPLFVQLCQTNGFAFGQWNGLLLLRSSDQGDLWTDWAVHESHVAAAVRLRTSRRTTRLQLPRYLRSLNSASESSTPPLFAEDQEG